MARYIGAIMVLMVVPTMVLGYAGLIKKVHSDIPMDRAEGISQAVYKYSNQYNVDPDLIISMMWQETHFKNVIGDKNLRRRACGYMQVQVQTAESMLGYETTCRRIIYDWEEGIRAGVKFFAKKKAEFGFFGAIGSYNLGYESKVNYDYVKDILDKYQRIKAVRD
jgi:soluble lytic murein transglycosylase-like protein